MRSGQPIPRQGLFGPAGQSLLELVLVMALLGLLSAGLVQVIARSWSRATAVQEQQELDVAVPAVLSLMGREIRAAGQETAQAVVYAGDYGLVVAKDRAIGTGPPNLQCVAFGTETVMDPNHSGQAWNLWYGIGSYDPNGSNRANPCTPDMTTSRWLLRFGGDAWRLVRGDVFDYQLADGTDWIRRPQPDQWPLIRRVRVTLELMHPRSGLRRQFSATYPLVLIR